MIGWRKGVVAVLWLSAPGMLDAQEAPAVALKPHGYAQVQFNTSSVDNEKVAGSTFEFRRVRLGVDIAVREWITGRIETDITNGRLRPSDVFMNLQIDPALGLQVGQFKKPFSAIELTSSSKVIPIERNTRIRGLADALIVDDAPSPSAIGDEHGLLDTFGYLGRDIGAALHGELGRFGYSVGIFNGAGANQPDANDGKSFAGRLEFTPGEMPLRFGAAASHRETGVGAAERDGIAFEVDAEWGAFRRPGLRVIGEVTTGDNLVLDDATFTGAQVWASWFRPLDGARVEGLEPLVRASWGDPGDDTQDDSGVLVTPGVNVYFFGRNRLMLNWDVYMPADSRFETAHAVRVQLQLYPS